SFSDLVRPLLERQDLTPDAAESLMTLMMSGDATDAQIGATLMALRIKGCTADELASFASVLRSNALAVPHGFEDLVDTCGTGGGIPSFNISTAAAIVASAA